MNPQRLPSFIIIGAMKAATTSLYRYLSSHPDINPSFVKETDFFKSDRDFRKGLSWYSSQFCGGLGNAFEASPNYAKRHIFPGVPERMHSVVPAAKLIYILRDPVERTISHYLHNYTHGRELRSFSEAIKDKNCNYIQTSKYFYQIKAFLKYYHESQLLLVETEKLQSDPISVFRTVSDFLNIPVSYDDNIIGKRFNSSRSKTKASSFEKFLTSRTDNELFLTGIRKITSVLREPVKRPLISSQERFFLEESIFLDVEELRRFSGLRLSSWSI